MDAPSPAVRFEQDVLLGVATSPRSLAYCERDGLWVVGTQNGMAVYSAVPSPMLSPLPALPSLLGACADVGLFRNRHRVHEVVLYALGLSSPSPSTTHTYTRSCLNV
jgi:hypothetical protein